MNRVWGNERTTEKKCGEEIEKARNLGTEKERQMLIRMGSEEGRGVGWARKKEEETLTMQGRKEEIQMNLAASKAKERNRMSNFA